MASETRTTRRSAVWSMTAGSSKTSDTRAVQPLVVRMLWWAHTRTVLSMTPRLASSQKSAARIRRPSGLTPRFGVASAMQAGHRFGQPVDRTLVHRLEPDHDLGIPGIPEGCEVGRHGRGVAHDVLLAVARRTRQFRVVVSDGHARRPCDLRRRPADLLARS